MIITIDEKYYVERDERNYTLKEKTGKVDKNNNSVDKTHGYFSSLLSTMTYLKHLKVLSSASKMTIDKYIKEVKRVNDELNSILKGVE